MAGQLTWGNAGDANNAYIVNPRRQKELYVKATWNTVVASVTGGRRMERQIVRFGNKSETFHVGNSSAIWETEITTGNEERLTMVEQRLGMPSGYGDYAVRTGNADKYKHAVVWINQIDSEAAPLPGRCSQKQVKDILSDPKTTLLDGQKLWAAQEIDLEFARACIMGASRNLLATTEGGLGISLYNCSAGQFSSCYNTYVAGTGMVTKNVTRATYEAAIGTAMTSLSDNQTYGFNLKEHRKMVDLLGSNYFKKPDMGGKSYTSIVLSDPWLVNRLAALNVTASTTSAWYNIMKDAAARGKDNPLIDNMSPIELDGVLYVPWEPLKAFRASVVGGLPVYGAGTTYDPRTYIASNTSKICAQIWLGAGAVLRATDRKIWITAEKDRHKENFEYSLHWDDGFVRREYFAKDGRTEKENDAMIVGWWYDPGTEVPFAA